LFQRLVTRLAGKQRGALRQIREQRFETDELVTILLQDRRGERLASDHEHGLAVFLELVHQRNEIAVAADDGEGVHVRMRESHLQASSARLISAPFLSPRGEGNPLHHLYGVSRHLARGAVLAAPVGVSELGDDVAALLEAHPARATRRTRVAVWT
jgi:hypothetical protein